MELINHIKPKIMDEYMGIIKMFAGTFAPRGWMFCQGQLLSIAQYQALYAIFGTTYGGDGMQTFALPNLCGRVAVGTGTAQRSGTNYQSGNSGGDENTTLITQNIPAHVHNTRAQVSRTNASYSQPTGKSVLAAPGSMVGREFQSINGYTDEAPDTQLNTKSILEEVVGAGTPFKNMQPYTALSYIICVQGVYPPRE